MLARSPFSAAPMRLFIPSDLRALVGLRVALVAGRWLGPTAIRNSKWSDRCNNIEGI